MHIPDGFLDPAICALMYAVSICFLAWAWVGAKKTLSRLFVPLVAVSSALVFAGQMLNFPIIHGTSGHLIGGTFLAVLLGPHAAIISMSIVLFIQALFFADGGISAFGANVFNMAVIGGLSFYIVKLFSGADPLSGKRFFVGVFIASWLSTVLGALACGLQIGFSQVFAQAGGVAVTVPAMLFWHLIIGMGEATITTSLTAQFIRVKPSMLRGLALLREVPT